MAEYISCPLPVLKSQGSKYKFLVRYVITRNPKLIKMWMANRQPQRSTLLDYKQQMLPWFALHYHSALDTVVLLKSITFNKGSKLVLLEQAKQAFSQKKLRTLASHGSLCRGGQTSGRIIFNTWHYF